MAIFLQRVRLGILYPMESARNGEKIGLTRESLYKALSAEGNPEFASALKILEALDLKFAVKAA